MQLGPGGQGPQIQSIVLAQGKKEDLESIGSYVIYTESIAGRRGNVGVEKLI